MKYTSANKTILILFGAIIIPIIFYTGYQVRSINQNERMLSEIYKNQLESILFSINQYSDDIIKSLEFKLESRINNQQSIVELLNSYPGINEIVLRPQQSDQLIYAGGDSLQYGPIADLVIQNNSELIDRLTQYKEMGFTKLEPLDPINHGNEQHNVLIMLVGTDESALCILFIDPTAFIEDFLGPKMQEISAEQFIITARNSHTSQFVFATDSLDQAEDLAKPFWLLPNYNLGIIQKGESLEKIASERFRFNLIWSIILSIVLIFGFVVIARNIRKEIQFAQMKSDFASSVSHEIRTPLTLINMFAETLLLNRVPNEEKKREYYEIITKETSRLKNIVNKILNFAKIETNQRTYELLDESINDIIKETIHTYSFHLNNKGFSYEVQYEEGLADIRADREAIIEAIINLIDNAMKYSGESKKIEINTGSTEQHAFVSVTDFGIGIDPKKQQLIFDKFFRVTHGDIYNVQGAGLGLSIVKNIMDAHEGKIELSSKPGNGSTFTLKFPFKSTQHG